MIVDKPCIVVIDLEISKSNNYAVNYLKYTFNKYYNTVARIVFGGGGLLFS